MTTKALVLLLFILLTIAPIPAKAEQQPQRAPAQTQTPQQPRAAAPLPPDAATREQVLQLFELVQIRSTIQATQANLDRQMKAMFMQSLQERGVEFTAQQRKQLEELMNGLREDIQRLLPIDTLLEAFIPVYQRHLSASDLDAIIAFYKSPVGRKMLTEQPQMLQESFEAVAPLQEHAMRALMESMDERVEKIMADPANRVR